MAQDFARGVYKSSAWQKNRRNYLNAPVDTAGEVCVMCDDGWHRRSDDAWVPSSSVVPPGMCERCFARGELNVADIVHHKVHLTPKNINDTRVTLSYDNLQRLCRDCHAVVHSGHGEPRATFDESGNLVRNDRTESFRAQVARLLETADDRRNIYSRRRNGR
jgi:5-methylcytosine-specific restriction endonuclease McrA